MDKLINEKELLCQLAEGDENAFARLHDHYRNHVFLHALTYVKSNELAEEIVQDIFLKIWTGRVNMKKVQNFKAYLFILSKNHLISSIRKKVTILSKEPVYLTENILVPDQQLEVKETMHLIIKGIGKLSPQQKAVFNLSRFENLRYDEISERLDISKTTVKFHMMSALENLKKFMRVNIVHPAVLLAICIQLIVT